MYDVDCKIKYSKNDRGLMLHLYIILLIDFIRYSSID